MLELPICCLSQRSFQVFFPQFIIEFDILSSSGCCMISLLEHWEIYLWFDYAFQSHCCLTDLSIKLRVFCRYFHYPLDMSRPRLWRWRQPLPQIVNVSFNVIILCRINVKTFFVTSKHFLLSIYAISKFQLIFVDPYMWRPRLWFLFPYFLFNDFLNLFSSFEILTLMPISC